MIEPNHSPQDQKMKEKGKDQDPTIPFKNLPPSI
jgi:hypothetical protein